MYDFDKAIDRRGTTSIKWNKQYAFGQKDGLLPFWIADTDFASVPEILDAVLQVFPLDSYVEKPFSLMEVMPGDDVETPIWDTYQEIEEKYEARGKDAIGHIERFAFYEEAKKAYAIIATGETALYANVMLQKGVVTD